MAIKSGAQKKFDVFLSHSSRDADWVQELGGRLQDEKGLKVWLDKWTLVPGRPWVRELEQALRQTSSCGVCLGAKTPARWFREEIELALAEQSRRPKFRVIPILLPGASTPRGNFLALRTWADFRDGKDPEYAFHVLVQGIQGLPIGRWPVSKESVSGMNGSTYKEMLRELQDLSPHLRDEVVIKYQVRIMEDWYKDKR